jgi:hypothetical protein
VVHVANYLAHENPVRPRSEGDSDSYSYLKPDPEYLENLGLTDQVSAWNEYAETAAIEMRGGPKRETHSPMETSKK